MNISTTNFDVTQGTIALWVKPNSPANANDSWMFFDTYPTNYVDQRIILWKGGTRGTGGTNLMCGVDNWKDLVFNISDWNTNEWYHIAMVWRAKNDGADYIKLFINGVKVIEQGQLSKEMHTIKPNAIIGRHFGKNDSHYNGGIDDFRIFNRSLSDSEIASLFNLNTSSNNCSMIYCDEGNVGIGTEKTHGYRLAVAGDIVSKGVKVIAKQANWPDFVFEKEYNLKSLEETEQYISINKHLPEIPSEAEVIENGINLGEMDAKLLQKIEELTLYLIEQNKKNETQQKLIKELQTEVSILKNR